MRKNAHDIEYTRNGQLIFRYQKSRIVCTDGRFDCLNE